MYFLSLSVNVVDFCPSFGGFSLLLLWGCYIPFCKMKRFVIFGGC